MPLWSFLLLTYFLWEWVNLISWASYYGGDSSPSNVSVLIIEMWIIWLCFPFLYGVACQLSKQSRKKEVTVNPSAGRGRCQSHQVKMLVRNAGPLSVQPLGHVGSPQHAVLVVGAAPRDWSRAPWAPTGIAAQKMMEEKCRTGVFFLPSHLPTPAKLPRQTQTVTYHFQSSSGWPGVLNCKPEKWGINNSVI